jgi:hypothetical protein
MVVSRQASANRLYDLSSTYLPINHISAFNNEKKDVCYYTTAKGALSLGHQKKYLINIKHNSTNNNLHPGFPCQQKSIKNLRFDISKVICKGSN